MNPNATQETNPQGIQDLGSKLSQLFPQQPPQITTDAVNQAAQMLSPQQGNSMILDNPSEITQHYGNVNPGVEVMSGGIARGTNLAASEGDPVRVPPGRWQVVNMYDKATGAGIGDAENAGYGNAVLLQNLDTGERLHMTHFSKVNVGLGDMVQPGQVIGNVGQTGNTTGPHLNLEYYDSNGQIGDVLQSPYRAFIPIKQ